MKLKDIIKIPNFLLNKQVVRLQFIKLESIKLIDSNILLKFLVPSAKNPDIKYSSSILINTTNQISGNNDCKFKCSCDNFKYEYETILHKYNSLIGTPSSLKFPKRPKLFVCKHLYMCTNVLLKFRSIGNLSYVFKIKIEGEKDDSN